MATSTGIVLTAGGLAMGDLILNGYNPHDGLKIAVGTTLAAFVSAGLDKVIPGFGTGLAVLLLVGAVLRNGPRIADKLFPDLGIGQTVVGQGIGTAK